MRTDGLRERPVSGCGLAARLRRGTALLFAAAALLCAATTAEARNGDEALNHYGLVTLTDNATAARLAARFKARGQPVFLVHDVNAGLGQGDIMRFADKAVLVDADVWSTLQAEGALEKLRAAPLVRVQGRATAASWEQRADLVSADRQRKAFRVGAELLRVLEENFGGAPQGQQMTVIFERNHLTLLAPAALLDQLRYSEVRKVQPGGRPRIISEPPDSLLFTGQPFTHRVWAADPSDPSGDLTYQLTGTPPPGLTWNAATHTLSGTPTAAGRWRVLAIAQNKSGLRDTLPLVLRFRENLPPQLAGEAGTVAVVGREWSFAPMAVDPDHPAGTLRVRAGRLPAGMTFQPDSLLLRWTPAAALAGTRQGFTLTVEDPLGLTREHRYSVQVVKRDEILLTEGVQVELPWDTLVRGRNYVWRTGALAAAWAGQGIRLLSVSGPDSTRFSGDTLRLRPMSVGMHPLTFRFLLQGAPHTEVVELYARDDLPPEFVTELADWRVRLGDPVRRYRPVALDPEGEPVVVTAHIPDGAAGAPFEWDGTRLSFRPTRAGVYTARFTARDAGGKTTEQWVAFRADPERANSHWVVEGRMHGEYTAWTVTKDFGTGRIGLYTPNLIYGTIPWSYWMYKETPYVFIGGNLLGRRADANERFLWADVGFALGRPSARVYTGGIFTRIHGEWYFPSSPFSRIEMESNLHVHRAMFATDSSMMFNLLQDPDDIISRTELSEDGTLSRILRDGFREDNVRLFTRVEALAPLGFGLYAGPAMWREDWPMGQRSEQRFGGALRLRKTDLADSYQVTARLGRGSEAGWGGYVSVRLAFGGNR